MIIRNKYLGITSKDVEKETSILTLKQWLIDIEENIFCMETAISEAKNRAYYDKVFSDREWFSRITTAARLQKLLKIYIESRLEELELLKKKELKNFPDYKKIVDYLKQTLKPKEWEDLLQKVLDFDKNLKTKNGDSAEK